MDFIRIIPRTRRGETKGFGSLIICDGMLRITINEPNSYLKEIGVIQDGIGAILEKSNKKKKTPYVKNVLPYSENDIPIHLQGEKYKFSIPAKKISDNEFVFMFKDAVMLNKK